MIVVVEGLIRRKGFFNRIFLKMVEDDNCCEEESTSVTVRGREQNRWMKIRVKDECL